MILRLQVEEGFLDGLDIEFTKGLNVLIGARGTGKTSVIELLRFALGVPGYTSESGKRAIEHALSVLGSGRVTVTVANGTQRIRAIRAAADDKPRFESEFRSPVIFSQTEIENVGLDRTGRLRLIDGFLDKSQKNSTSEDPLHAAIKSLTSEIESKGKELTAFEDQLAQLTQSEKALKELAPQEQMISKSSALSAEKKRTLDVLSKQSTSIAIRHDALNRFRELLSTWTSQIETTAKRAPQTEAWSGKSSEDPLVDIRIPFIQAQKQLAAVLLDLAQVRRSVESRDAEYQKQKNDLADKTRTLRKEIEGLQQGAGEITRSGATLREKIAQLEALKPLIQGLKDSRQQLHDARGELLDKLEKVRETRFKQRCEVAAALTKSLGPLIRIDIERSAHFDIYISLITQALRGSGIKYNELAPTIAEKISPRELLETVEAGDVDTLADLLDISKERSGRIISQLKDRSLADLAVCNVDDNVRLTLLDGLESKALAELSTGQRCTVILPIILKHGSRPIIVDQPEDHIDNAFIVGTLIQALKARSPDSQILFSTHNANIPVLGEADQVIQMGSDGRRGFVVQQGKLDDPSAVTAISSIMEGGKEAFAKRADFYQANASATQK